MTKELVYPKKVSSTILRRLYDLVDLRDKHCYQLEVLADTRRKIETLQSKVIETRQREVRQLGELEEIEALIGEAEEHLEEVITGTDDITIQYIKEILSTLVEEEEKR